METTETTTPTPAPKKKGYGSILLILGLVGVLIYFCGSYFVGLVGTKSSADSTLVNKIVSDSLRSDSNALATPVSEVADTTKKSVADSTKHK